MFIDNNYKLQYYTRIQYEGLYDINNWLSFANWTKRQNVPVGDVPAGPAALVLLSYADSPRHHHGCLNSTTLSLPKYVSGPRPIRLAAYADRVKCFRTSSGPFLSRRFLRFTRYSIEPPPAIDEDAAAVPVTLSASHSPWYLLRRTSSSWLSTVAYDDDLLRQSNTTLIIR